ncbi:MAG: DNA polymerase III subunit delta [Lachnospiraceae bacterium]|nr:DNA polymerase III subunit delta [Lachnospiraceae bacterium]
MTNTFDSIIGQEHIREHLKTTLISGKVSQAYLITGESMQGKEFIARIFANALVCEHPRDGYDPCTECKNCIQAATRNHPDIITVTHDKPNTVSVEDVRQQIVSDAQIKPYQSRWKIYIMNEAEKMTPQAQNAILKTLEEPPEYVVIMLLTTSKSSMLPTVLSRCVQLDMRPVEDSVIKNYLMSEIRIPDYKADICTAFARGNVGKARSLAVSEDFDGIKEETVRVLKFLRKMDTSDIIKTLKKFEEYKLNINDLLDLMMIWYRDVLLYKATMDEDHMIFRGERDEIIKEANDSSYEGIEGILKILEKTKERLKANVNFEMAMELMLLTIKENQR